VRTLPKAVALAAIAGATAIAIAFTGPATANTSGSNPATWQPWHLTSAQQYRLGPPPSAASATTKRELVELRRLQRQRTPATQRLVQKWLGQPGVLPWTDELLRLIKDYRPRPPFAARVVALFQTGLADATIAAYDSQNAHAKARPAPWKLDPRIKPAVKPDSATTYPPYQAAMAGTAEKILKYLFPAEPTRTFTRLANEATKCLLSAGLAYRSDVKAGRALGHQVAATVIADGEADGSKSTGFSNGPLTGAEYWSPTAPGYEAPTGGPVGKWKPILMSSAGQLRSTIPGPSKYGTPAFMAQLQEVLSVSKTLTPQQKQIADFWDDRPGTFTPAGHWVSIGTQLIKAYKTPGPRAARILAYLGAVEYDAAVAFFEAKYHWWSIRPITAMWRLCDGGGTLCTEAEVQATPGRATYRNKWFSYIATPSFPSYPGGHSTFSGGAGKLLGYFFPKAANSMAVFARQAANSRLYGGIHFDEDNDGGLVLGQAVADLAIKRAGADRAGAG
jgi:membrane-associated phospholipid phosphatase